MELYGKVEDDRTPLVSIAPEFFRSDSGLNYVYDRRIFDGHHQLLYPFQDVSIFDFFSFDQFAFQPFSVYSISF